jgi:hypothetical protein
MQKKHLIIALAVSIIVIIAVVIFMDMSSIGTIF